ncbi:hypothetical protein M9H77_30055 [Catharanthus roseus]|uniref:Uncharacterized protein n=1 Tax=Catharanthus roseus TaxID=4058 RepID=A0ACC0A0F3_CATRO|nr:hypothetical protein M9H77_30055 [Catharanthus roseus]
MDPFEESPQENICFEGDEDPNTFEEFLDPEEYIDLGHLFTTDRIFSSKDELVEWVKQIAMNAKTYLIITRSPKIYNVVSKIKRDQMQRRNTVQEVLCLSAERGYTVFYRNCKDSNVLSDIVVAHPTSIAMIRMWLYVLIMDTTYKTNKIWTSQVLHFRVETTNRAESEHLVLKLWLSTCHGDLDTVFFNIDSLIQAQVAEIKYSLEISRLKEKYGAKTVVNPPETAVTKGRRKTNSTKRDKSHWEYISIAHRKIGKSSGSGSGSGSSSGFGSNPSPRGRGRPPRSGRSKGRGRSSGRSSLSTVVSPDSLPVPFLFKNAFPGFMYQFIQNWKNVVGDGNCGFRVVKFLVRDENHWVEIRRRMSYDLQHHMHLQLVDGCPLPPLHVQWEYHRDIRVSG